MKQDNNLDIKWCQTLNEKWLTIVSVNSDNIESIQTNLILAYKKIFSASAWKEGKKCANWCGNKWSFEEAPLTCCQKETIDYYSDEEVKNSIYSVIQKTTFQCLVVLEKDWNAVWFTWWWCDSLVNINSEKLALSENKYTELVWNLGRIKDNPEKTNWYYQSETWIIPEYRTMWIGKILVNSNDNLLWNNRDKINAIIQRTSQKSPMYNIRKQLWYEVVLLYEDADERVIFAKNNK